MRAMSPLSGCLHCPLRACRKTIFVASLTSGDTLSLTRVRDNGDAWTMVTRCLPHAPSWRRTQADITAACSKGHAAPFSGHVRILSNLIEGVLSIGVPAEGHARPRHISRCKFLN